MRLHRFYINEPILSDNLSVCEERLVHQWRDVFRYNTGSEIIIFDGSGLEFDAVIEKLSNREAKIVIVSKRKGILPKRRIVLYQSLIKKDKMEWVVEKATEIGVSKIVPIVSERSEKKGFNTERARKIATEASEQCGRADVPEIEDGKKILDFSPDPESQIVIFDKSGPSFESSLISKKYNQISIFIGPEGGWTPAEIERFKEAKIEIFSLGEFTLRAETATIVALAKLNI